MRRSPNSFAIIALATSVGIVALATVARVPTYHFAPLFLIPAVWAGYFMRRRIHLHPLHYALVCLAVLLHMLGALGYYQHSPLPFSFDICVHFYFAFALAFVIHRLIGRKMKFAKWMSIAATLIVIMALGALHEVMEYATLVLGDQNAMLKKDSYPWDTNRDLTNNFLGCIVALLIIALVGPKSPWKADTFQNGTA